MTEERRQIVIAVFEGRLPADAITMEELHELEDAVFEAVAAKKTAFDTWETLQ